MALPANLPLGVTAVMLPELDFPEQLRLCQTLGITHYVLRPRRIPDQHRTQPFSNWGNHAFDLTPQRLVDQGPELAAQLNAAGLTPFATVPALTVEAPDDELALQCRGALRVGTSRIRLTPASVPHDQLYDWPQLLDRLHGRFRDALQIADHAQRDFPHASPLKFTVEIHTGLPTPCPGLARALVEPFDPKRLGVICDLPNLAREGLTAPAVTISTLGPYLDHCHVGGARRSPQPPDPRGFTGSDTAFTSLRDSDLHLPTWLNLLAKHAEQLGQPIPLICEDFTPSLPGAQRLTRTVHEIHDAFHNP